MSEAPKSHNGSLTTLDSAMTSDEVDSDAEGGGNGGGIPTTASVAAAAKSYFCSGGAAAAAAAAVAAAAAAETKRRNKRKNFQPRNIAYSETDPAVTEPFAKRERTPSESSEENYALDLSNVEMVRASSAASSKENDAGNRCSSASETFKEAEETPKTNKDKCKNGGVDGGEEDSAEEMMESSPMDLSCSKSTSPYPYNHVNSYYSDSEDSEEEEVVKRRPVELKMPTKKELAESFKPSSVAGAPPQYFLHPFLGHGGDVSDFKQYAQNTVKELLDIFDFDSDMVTDVAQTIGNNVPMSNFSSGEYDAFIYSMYIAIKNFK